MITPHDDNHYMRQAYQQALAAEAAGEIPIGAVVVAQNRIIAKAHNQVERLKDPTAHAEVLAITAATHYLGTKYLNDCTLYVTLEPCTMCAGAMFWSQIGRLVYGAEDTHRGFSRLENIKGGDPVLHPKTALAKGVMAEESAALLAAFFKKLRQK